MESVHKALNPLVDFTDALSDETYVSVSCVKPVLQLFNEEVLKPGDDDTELTKAIKTTVTNNLNEKYDEAATDDMASLVDPRFKTCYIQGHKVEAVKSRAVAKMLVGCLITLESTLTSRLGGGRADATASATSAKMQKTTLGSFFKKSYSVSTSGLIDKQAVEAELNS